RAPLDTAFRDEIERRDALGDARGMVVVRWHQSDAMSKTDVLRALRASCQEHFRRGGVRVFLEKVMFDFPSVVDAETIGEFHLVERVLEELKLRTLLPGPRKLVLVEDPEFHAASLPGDLTSLTNYQPTFSTTYSFFEVAPGPHV